MIDVYKGRGITGVDVPELYLCIKLSGGKNKTRLIIKFTGDFVDIVCTVKPEFNKHAVYEDGKTLLYLLMLRAIYGCIGSARC